MKLIPPVKDVYVTQPFGVNYVGFYQRLGLIAHNGTDFRARNGCPILASHDGVVTYAGRDSAGGIGIKVFNRDYRCETFYYHNKKNIAKKDQSVKAGEVIALADNTGKYTTADHLHFALYKTDIDGNRLNRNNGYNGAIDPTEFFEKGWNKSSAYHRYGRKQNWQAEFKMRFKNLWLHRQLIARGNLKLVYDTEFINALVYGGWALEDVLNPAMRDNWAYLKKDEYTRGLRPFN